MCSQIVKPVQAQPLASAVPTCSVADAKDAAGAGLTTDPSTPKGQQKHLSGVYVMQGLPQAGATQKSRFAAREQVHRLLAMTVIVIAAVRGGVVWAAALTCWVTCAVAQASDAPPRPLAVCCTPVLASMVTWWLMRGPPVQGDSSTTDYRVFLQQEGKDISSWHDIPLRNADGTLNFVCEIPKETAAKMEVATVSRAPACRNAGCIASPKCMLVAMACTMLGTCAACCGHQAFVAIRALLSCSIYSDEHTP